MRVKIDIDLGLLESKQKLEEVLYIIDRQYTTDREKPGKIDLHGEYGRYDITIREDYISIKEVL